MSEERFVALELLEPIDKTHALFDPWRFQCRCGQCGGTIIHMAHFELLMTKHCRLLIGDFDDVAVVSTGTTSKPAHIGNKTSNDMIPCICVKSSDLPKE